ncbi:ABC transporter ATP-binding protein [Leifsonia sp. 71-9]|uniref:ABC transporter transmembrane domain-containing protein n=1 Tax=Leifsonia sp. 71-9 TaxID=1895934 RepID=UPI00092ABDD9|nr:ABC transporter ATP-binding protein [Leifsonia sp. 71-9]OJX77555.1 MAG: hypothetical protein BGO91_10545 [Leifsonia sp. 71-9]
MPSSSTPSRPAPVPRSPRALLTWAVGARRTDLALACLLYSTHQVGEALVPVVIGATVSGAIDGGTPLDLGFWLAVLAADFVLLSFSYRFGARASARAKQHAGHALRMRVVASVLGARPGATDEHAPGELLTRASSDADRVGGFVGVIASALAAAVALAAAATVLLLSSPLLLGAVIVLGTVAVLAANAAISRGVEARSGDEQREAGRAAVLAEDLVRGLRVVKGLAAETTASRRYTEASRAATGAATRAVRAHSLRDGVTVLTTGLYLLIVVGVGGWLALSGALSLGGLIASLGLAQFLAGPLQTLAAVPASAARARASAARILGLLRESDGRPHSDRDGEAEHVPATSPRAAPELAVTGPSGTITVAPGAMIGMPAGTAAEASRILRSLRDARGAGPGDVLVAPHESALFRGSPRDNVAVVGRPEGVEAALRAAFADEIVADDVGEGGLRLSGGQRQRVALARALAADPPVLVLHDPTTAIDAATEDVIAERVRAFRRGRTTIVVTTSPAWLARCDEVLPVDGGATARAIR